MSSEDAVTLSKSARKRANKKARDAGEAVEEEAPAPAPAPKSKAAAKPKAEPAPEPKAAAKGKAKAKAEPKAAEPKAEPKAAAKGKAAPKAAAEPKAAAKQEPKAAAKKAAAKKPAAAAPEPEEEKKDSGPLVYYEVDDGSRAGDWEVSSGLSNKAARQKARQQEKQDMDKQMKAANVIQARSNQHIPGLAPAEAQLAQSKGGKKAAANQSVGAVAVVSAAAAASKDAAPVAAVSDNSTTATVKVPENRIGVVVGPKGANIIMIKEKTGVKTIDMQGEVCTIVGSADAVTLAEHAVRQLVDKGYMALAYDDFEEEGVPVLPVLFPDIIGSKGCIIMAIKKEAKVEVSIPAVPKNPMPGKKYKITLAGSKAAVALGKEIINSIAVYGHHERTHPGMIHKEMEIEEWRYRYLIGSKGSEMRHIQNNYKVKVNIPREHSECQNVLVVGEPRDVERAVAYIEKIMYQADQPKGRGAQEKAIDDWGDDGEEEDWMKAYMYKR